MAPVRLPDLEKLELDPKKKDAEMSGEEDDDDGDGQEGEVVVGEGKKKKKKKKSKKKKTTVVQTEPPTIGLSKIFKNGVYPIGEEMDYKNDSTRRTSPESLERERLAQEDPSTSYQNIRRAAEVHRQVRAYAQKTIKPGMTMTEIAELIENGTRTLVEENGLESGIGFPTGLSVNEVAAHYTPNAGDTKVLQQSDVMKVDFGVHVNGRILDSAFTMNFEPTWDKLLEAVKDATNTGVKEAGIDVRLCDMGEVIQEVMESYEVEIGGKTLPIKSITNLNGHSITPYSIHGGPYGKSVPIVKQFGNEKDERKMEEGEYFAIETFGSTGRGRVIEEGTCSHYALSPRMPDRYTLHHQSAKNLLKSIQKNFGTLPFCRRYLDHVGEKNYLLALNTLVREGLVADYPPLVDPVPGAMTAQYEHTILLRPTCKEVVSRGDDY